VNLHVSVPGPDDVVAWSTIDGGRPITGDQAVVTTLTYQRGVPPRPEQIVAAAANQKSAVR
jgi:hypothetical protein